MNWPLIYHPLRQRGAGPGSFFEWAREFEVGAFAEVELAIATAGALTEQEIAVCSASAGMVTRQPGPPG